MRGHTKKSIFKFSILALPLFSSFNAFDVFPGGMKIIDIIFFWSLIVFFISALSSIRLEVAYRVFAILIGFSYSSIVFILGGGEEFTDVIRIWVGLFWSVIAYNFMSDNEDFRDILKFLFCSAVLISLYQIYIYLTVSGVHRIGGYYGYADGQGLDRQPSYNEVGAFLSFGVMASWICFARMDKRIFYIFCVALCFLGLLLTGSRSSILAVLISFLVFNFTFFKYGDNSYRFVFLLSIILVFGSSLHLLSNNSSLHVFSRLASTFDPTTNAGNSMQTRLDLWRSAFDVASDEFHRFLIGFGRNSGFGDVGTRTLENFWLDTFFSYGLLGFSIVLFFLIYPFLSLSKINVKDMLEWDIIKSFTIIILVVSMTGNVLADPMVLSTYLIFSYSLLAKYKRGSN